MALDNTKPQTLADVLDNLTDGTHEENFRHRTRVSAIRRISAFLHRPPTDLPADVKSLRPQLEDLHPAQCGVTEKTLNNIKSGLADALKATGVINDDPRGLERTIAWAEFLANAVSDHQRWGLSRFVDYCCRQHIDPEDVTQEVFDEFQQYLDVRLLTRSPAKHCKSAADTWNHLLRVNRLPLERLAWKRERRYTAQPLSAYPQSLQDEIDAYLSRLAHEDIFAEGGPDKPLRPTSLRNIKAHLAQYLDALVSAGTERDKLTSLRSARRDPARPGQGSQGFGDG